MMNDATQPQRWRYTFIALVIAAEIVHLAWEFFHGGVRTHHFLQLADMPGLSNWWGLFLLPALAWFLTARIQRRRALLAKPIMIGFVIALMLGVALSTAFMIGQENISSFIFFGMLLSAIVLPVYRSECVMGFIFGMTFTFGAVLPTFIASVIATISATLHLFLYPALGRAWGWLKHR
jgi:hypothetical protein